MCICKQFLELPLRRLNYLLQCCSQISPATYHSHHSLMCSKPMSSFARATRTWWTSLSQLIKIHKLSTTNHHAFGVVLQFCIGGPRILLGGTDLLAMGSLCQAQCLQMIIECYQLILSRASSQRMDLLPVIQMIIPRYSIVLSIHSNRSWYRAHV